VDSSAAIQIKIFTKRSTDALRQFAEAYKAFAAEERFEVPDLKEGELRPYIPSLHWNGITPPWMLEGIQFVSLSG